MPNRWTMGVQECSYCGASLRFGDDAHECGSRSEVEYDLATTEEQKALLSETVRRIYGIDDDLWYAGRPHWREIVLRHQEQKG
ncbi:MAG: hypothetical protein DWH91_12210 [Planctomycetota bacterium]|nr:MAG: hypothetical protein DWH91_12210 [Planctomycetota bacterium]